MSSPDATARNRDLLAPADSPSTPKSSAPLEQRILIFAPSGSDGPFTANFLQQAGLQPYLCRDMSNLSRRIAEGCGAILLAEETLEPESNAVLTETLGAQPSWSDLPVGIVTSGGELTERRLSRLKIFGRNSNFTLLERPFRPATLVRLCEVALRTRQRQYQVRDLLGIVQASEARLRRILEQTAIGIAELDLEGRFTLVNDQFCFIAGRKRDDLLQRHIRDITHPEDLDLAVVSRQAILEGQSVRRVIEKRYVRPDGTLVWVQDHLSGIRDTQGKLCGIAVASADITDRKLAQEAADRARDEAIAASRAKDNFLAALSHELRTPLNPVLLLASEGTNNADYPSAARGDFATIARNVSLEARLFDDLLDLTRITRGKLSIERRPHQIHDSLRDALTTVEEDIRQRQIILKQNLASESPVVLGDGVRLQQVFWNVLKNAVKFTPMRGTITVTTRVTADRTLITITDSGIGLTADELPRIFETFAQGDHAADHGAHRFGGLGLGLAISKTLVELHGGSIRASSAGRDAGAAFTIDLPLLCSAAVPSEISKMNPSEKNDPAISGVTPYSASGKRQRLLIVEDHEPTRLALSRLLVRREYEVFIAGSVAEALEIASRTDIELILSDIGLPDGSGYDVMRELSAVHRVRGIALTGYGQDRDVALSREAGFIAHLTKPVDVRSLDKALAELNTASVS